jgi:hypothetical protein
MEIGQAIICFQQAAASFVELHAENARLQAENSRLVQRIEELEFQAKYSSNKCKFSTTAAENLRFCIQQLMLHNGRMKEELAESRGEANLFKHILIAKSAQAKTAQLQKTKKPPAFEIYEDPIEEQEEPANHPFQRSSHSILRDPELPSVQEEDEKENKQ